jgi:hypothetical protein
VDERVRRPEVDADIPRDEAEQTVEQTFAVPSRIASDPGA